MKVLHVIPWLQIGGTENLLVNHLSQLASDWPQVENRLVVLGPGKDVPPDYLDRLPVAPVFLELDLDYRNPLKLLRMVKGLAGECDRMAPDIVHSYLWTADIVAALAARRSCFCHVAHVLDRRTNRHGGSLKQRLRVRFTAALLKRSRARFAAVSQACRAHAIENFALDPGSVVTAHNGVTPAAFKAARAGSGAVSHFGSISRLAWEKGIEHLIEAFALVAQKNRQARLTIAGGGPALDGFRQEVRKRGLEQQIALPGRVESAAEFYRSLDCFVIPSTDAEGLPTTILEAMASGLAVIATDVGGAGEAVIEGEQGLVVPPGRAEALAGAILQMIENPARARAMGQAGRMRVEAHFTVKAMTGKIVEEVYRPALAQAGRAGPPSGRRQAA